MGRAVRVVLLTGVLLTLAGASRTVAASAEHGSGSSMRRLMQSNSSAGNFSQVESAAAFVTSPPPSKPAFQCWGSTERIPSLSWAANAKAVDCPEPQIVVSPTPSTGGNADNTAMSTSAANNTGSAGSAVSTNPGTTPTGSTDPTSTPAATGRRLLQQSGNGTSNGTDGGVPAFSAWTGADDGCVTRDEYSAMFGSDPSTPPFDSKSGLGDVNLDCISQADENAWLQQSFCVQYMATLDGASYTAGGCLSQIAQGALAQVQCDYDGQMTTISAPFMGQGEPVQLTVFCCMTPLCNKCSNGLTKIKAPPPPPGTAPQPGQPIVVTPTPSTEGNADNTTMSTSAANNTGSAGSAVSTNPGTTPTGSTDPTATPAATGRRLLQQSGNGTSNGTDGGNGTTNSASSPSMPSPATALAPPSTTPSSGSSSEAAAPPSGILRDVYKCAAAAPSTPAATPKPPPDVGGEVTLLAFEQFTLPSAEVLASEGFIFKFSDPQYANLGASIPPGAWPPDDTRNPSLTLYQASDSHLKAQSDMEGSEVAGLLIDFQPSPITFLLPVTVSLPVDGIQDNVSYSAAMFDEENLTWVLKSVSDGKETLVNGTVQGETMSFSLYAALSYPTPSACNTACIIGSVIGGVVGLLCCCGIGYYLYTTSQDGAAAYGADEEDAGEEEALPPPKPRDIENPSGPASTAAPQPKRYTEISGGEDEEDEDGEHVYDV